jgi:amino acid permease
MLKTVSLAMFLTCLIYIIVALTAIALFGSNLSSNIMLDIENIGPISLVIRIVFLVVIICHVPFTFICAKEGACVAVDEAIN